MACHPKIYLHICMYAPYIHTEYCLVNLHILKDTALLMVDGILLAINIHKGKLCILPINFCPEQSLSSLWDRNLLKSDCYMARDQQPLLFETRLISVGCLAPKLWNYRDRLADTERSNTKHTLWETKSVFCLQFSWFSLCDQAVIWLYKQ